jgi:hypothetical protein
MFLSWIPQAKSSFAALVNGSGCLRRAVLSRLCMWADTQSKWLLTCKLTSTGSASTIR